MSALLQSVNGSQRHSQLLQMHDDLLTSHLLPLVSNDVLYVTMPQLCTVTRRLLAQSQLHKQHAQQRLSLSDVLWSEMRCREWQLAADEWDVDESANWEDDELQDYRIHEDEEEDEMKVQNATGDKPSVEVQRDWSIVCTQLHHRLTRLERLIFRHAPLNCYGDRYQLPDAFRALLVDAWTVRLLTSHLLLKAQNRLEWRTLWVTRPSGAIEELPPDCKDRVVSTSELPYLPIFLSCTERGGCDSLDCCDANPWRFVAIDCRPRAADGRQPADLNSAAIVTWQFDRDDYADIDVEYVDDSGTPSLRICDSAQQYLSKGGIRALYRRMPLKVQRTVKRLLLPPIDDQSDDAVEQQESDVESDEEEEEERDHERRHAARRYIFSPWKAKARKRKAESAGEAEEAEDTDCAPISKRPAL